MNIYPGISIDITLNPLWDKGDIIGSQTLQDAFLPSPWRHITIG
jgi:hypothetical protein